MIEEAVTKIRSFRDSNGLKNATLAKLAGLSVNALRDLDSPDWSPRYDTLRKLLAYIEAVESGQRDCPQTAGQAA